MKKTILLAAIILPAFFIACNNHEDKNDPKEIATEKNDAKEDNTKVDNDADFAVTAADAGMAEVKLGQLAQTNGSSAQVKALGKMMETDHGKADDELKAWAAKNNVSLPADISNDKMDEYNKMAAKKGAEFDKAYTEALVKGHEKVISAFQKEADGGKNAELKSWASDKLPTLQHHLGMSKAADDAVKNK